MNQIGLLWLVFDLPDQGSERDARTTEDEFAEPRSAKNFLAQSESGLMPTVEPV
jgi:hypothetical protein